MGLYVPPPSPITIRLQPGYSLPAITGQVLLCVRPPALGALAVDTEPPPVEASALFLERVFDATTEIGLATPEITASVSAQAPIGHDHAINLGLPAPDIAASVIAHCRLAYKQALVAAFPPYEPPAAVDIHGRQNLDYFDIAGPKPRPWQHQQAIKTHSGLRMREQQTLRTLTGGEAGQHHGLPIANGCKLRNADAWRTHSVNRPRHTDAIRIAANAGVPHTEALLRPQRPFTLRWQEAIRISANARPRHADTLRTRNRRALTEQQAVKTSAQLTWSTKQGQKTSTPLYMPHAQMLDASPGLFWPVYKPPLLSVPIRATQCGEYQPRPIHCAIRLYIAPSVQPHCPGFDPEPTPQPAIVIPVQEVYIVVNAFTLVRADDGTPIEASNFSCNLDRDSWTWQWSARIPAERIDAVMPSPDPVEVLASINGTTLRLVIERLSRERKFPDAWLSISGRGRSAWLSSPYAPRLTFSNAESRTAQQLMDDALKLNGVSIGWSVDFGLANWLVPAGAWNHTGTWIEAITRIAEAGGGYVQPHDTAKTLRILPHYPAMPRDWGDLTPNFVLPEDVCETESIEWLDKPDYNAVWIVGGEGGRKDRIRITGTAGDKPAPTIVDPLATDPQMTRQRGIAVLGDAGRQMHIRLRLPVLSETGIIRPGHIIDYTAQNQTRRGIVRGVNVSYNFPQAWQTVEVESHV